MKLSNKKTIVLFLALFLGGILIGGISNIVFNVKILGPEKKMKDLIQEKELLQEKMKLIKVSLINMKEVPMLSSDERVGVITEVKNNELVTDLFFPDEEKNSILADSWWLVKDVVITTNVSTKILAYDFTENISPELDNVKKIQLKDFSNLKIGDYIYATVSEELEENETNIVVDEIRVMMFGDNVQEY